MSLRCFLGLHKWMDVCRYSDHFRAWVRRKGWRKCSCCGLKENPSEELELRTGYHL